jgi:hypothetical protein
MAHIWQNLSEQESKDIRDIVVRWIERISGRPAADRDADALDDLFDGLKEVQTLLDNLLDEKKS